MARTDVASIQIVTKDGIIPSYEAGDATDGHMWRNSGREWIEVLNGGGGAVVVTIPTPAKTVDGLTIEDKAVTIGAGAEKKIGPFLPGHFNQPAGGTDAGKAYIDLDVDTTVTLGVFRS